MTICLICLNYLSISIIWEYNLIIKQMTENINKMMSYANIINKVIKINHTLKQFIIDVHICNSLTYTHSTVYKYS